MHGSAPQGNSSLVVQLAGLTLNGVPDGGVFLGTGLVQCAFSTNLRRVFSALGPVQFTPAANVASAAVTAADTQLTPGGPGVDWDMWVQTDQTVQVKIDGTGTTFKWRRFPVGAPDVSTAWTAVSSATGVTLATTAVTLQHGLTVTFGSTSGKAVGDTWQFDVLMANPSITQGTVLGSREASCVVPPYAALEPDTDSLLAGLQHEVKLSLRGQHGFSPVTQYSLPGGPATLSASTGAPQTPVLPWTANSAMLVDGFYTGDVEQTYEVTLLSATTFSWRRYSSLPSACDLYAAPGNTTIIGGDSKPTLAWQPLDQGVYVRFETQGNKPAINTSWVFTAKPFWSTGFSPVKETTAGVSSAATPATRLAPVGVLNSLATQSYVYEVNRTGSTFTWRRWPYGSTSASANNVSAALVVGSGVTPTALEFGLSLFWTNPANVTSGQSWTFTAFIGHTVTYGATSGTSALALSPSNATGTPVVTDATGTASVPAFVGTQTTAFTIVAVNATAFTFALNGGTPSAAIAIVASKALPLAYGVFLYWSSTAPTTNNIFTFYAAAVPSAAVVPATAPFTAIGVYAPGFAFSTRDATVAVYFVSATTFKWRNNTAPFSNSTLAVPSASPYTISLGDTGLVLRFSSSATISNATAFTIAITSFVPRVDNITTLQAGTRSSPSVSAAVPNPHPPQMGLPTGVAVPYTTNNGGSSPSLTVLPTPGFLGSAQAVTGGLSDSLPDGYPSNVAPGVYPVLYLAIDGSPQLGPVSSPIPLELNLTGTYTGATSLVFLIQFNTSDFVWASSAPGVTPTTFTAGHNIGSGLSASFASTYPVGTSWQFTAFAGASYKYRREGNAQWSATTTIVPAVPVPLCCGVSVIFSAATGYTPGDQWALLPLTVTPGGQYTGNSDAAFDLQISAATTPGTTQSAFQWRPAGGAWSNPQVISGVDFVVGDPHNVGMQPNATSPQLPNVHILSSGTLNSTAVDGTYVLQIESGGTTFRWTKVIPRIPFLAASLNSSLGASLTAALNSPATSWKAGVAITANTSVAVGAEGVAVKFEQYGSVTRAFGDTYFIEVRTGTTADLGLGLTATWSAPYGYTAGDQWHFNATFALAARGPPAGSTQLLVQGSNFLASNALSCQLVDAAGHQAVSVPATFVSSTLALCRSPPRTPDGLTVPVASRLGAPGVRVSGAYSGPRSVQYKLAVASVGGAATLTATVIDEGLPQTAITLGPVTTVADGVTWTELPDGQPGTGDALDTTSGVFAQFDLAGSAQCAGAQYDLGDSWTFTAYALAAAAQGGGDADPEVQPGSLKPGVLVNVSLSNDAGTAWADSGYLGNGLATFLYSPVYISPSGDDGTGDGTRSGPYSTLARGVGAALSDAQPGGVGSVPGLGSVTNWDEIVLLPGRYSGGGNSGVQPGGRALLVQASQRGGAVIDCAGSPGGDVVAGDKFAAPGKASTGSISLQGIATENCGAAYVGAAAAYPTMRWYGTA